MTLLIELLAHQFAMPVRWIETQALFFKDLGEGRTKPGFVFPFCCVFFLFHFVSDGNDQICLGRLGKTKRGLEIDRFLFLSAQA